MKPQEGRVGDTMTLNQSDNMNSAKLRDSLELIGIAAVVLSLIFVAYEIRQNTISARAAAIQEIGVATAEMWGEYARDPAMIRLLEGRTDIPKDEWTADDWSRFLAQMLAWSRLAETGLLQVKEGLLPASSLEMLGYADTKYWLQDDGFSCLWKYRLRFMVSEDFAAYVEAGPEPATIDCSSFSSFPFLNPRRIDHGPSGNT
jgi:hypothetical protein